MLPLTPIQALSLISIFLTGILTMRQTWNASWNFNTVGTQIMTATFVPLLLKSNDPRILFMTSGTSTLKRAERS